MGNSASPDSPYIVPAFCPPVAKAPEFNWWTWHPLYPRWQESCWGGSSVEEAVESLKTAGLVFNHCKLIRHDANGYTEVLDVPCERMDVWQTILENKAKYKNYPGEYYERV